MPFINFDHQSRKLQKSSGLTFIAHSIIGWLNGETITRKEDYLNYRSPNAECVTFDLIAPHLIFDRDIYVIDQRLEHLYERVREVAAAARSIASFDSLKNAVSSAMEEVRSSAIFVVNIDIFSDAGDAVEELLATRDLLNTVPIIICSTTFSRNDFSLHRSVIADTSFRLPCGNVSLALAIESGIRNNQTRGTITL